jgi:hypothetical protein
VAPDQNRECSAQRTQNVITARIDSLKMKLTGAPFFGSDIGDGFGEVPMVAVKVPSVVLALAVGLILGFGQDDGTILPRALAVTFSIFDANLDDVRLVGYHVTFSDGKAAITGLHLDAVIGDAETGREAKSL